MSDLDDAVEYTVLYLHPDHPEFVSVDISRKELTGRASRLVKHTQVHVSSLRKDIAQIAHVRLYKPIGLTVKPRTTLFARARQWLRSHSGDESLQFDPTGDTIEEAIREDRDVHDVDVMIVTPDIEESLDEVLELGATNAQVISKRETGAQAASETLPSPSKGVESFSGLQSVIKDHQDVFHAGRPHDNYGPPVALFNPILGLLAHRLSHLDEDDPAFHADHHDCHWAHDFMVCSLESYGNEDLRVAAIRHLLDSLYPNNVHWEETINKIKPSVLFGSALTTLPSGVGAIKNEAGLAGDASMQACLSYTKIVTEHKHATTRIRKFSNCPAIVLGLTGDIVEIGIAVYIDGAYSDFVFSSGRMRLDYYQNTQVLRLARAFKAVKLALVELDSYYEELRTARNFNVQHLFPSPRPVPSWHGDMPSITFTHRMSRAGNLFITATSPQDRQTGLYVGTMRKANTSASCDAPQEHVEVVIKFTTEYNEKAHRRLADAGFAPALHACVPVCGDVQMVVMERVQGEMAWCAKELLPHTVYDDVKSAIALLHENGLVFGDLRSPNIMCVDKSGSEGRLGAMLVDFDWAGEAGTARYPAVLNDSLHDVWAPGAERCGIMSPQHDLHLLEKFKALCHSG